MTRDPDVHAVGDTVVLPDGRTSTVKQVTRPHGVVRYLVHGRPGVAYTGTQITRPRPIAVFTPSEECVNNRHRPCTGYDTTGYRTRQRCGCPCHEETT